MTVNCIWNYSLLDLVRRGTFKIKIKRDVLWTGKMNRRWQFLLPPVCLLGF